MCDQITDDRYGFFMFIYGFGKIEFEKRELYCEKFLLRQLGSGENYNWRVLATNNFRQFFES